MLVLTFDPFVRTEQGYFLGNLRWCEIYLVVAERLDNRTDFCCICGQSLQFLLLYVELVGLVFKFFRYLTAAFWAHFFCTFTKCSKFKTNSWFSSFNGMSFKLYWL